MICFIGDVGSATAPPNLPDPPRIFWTDGTAFCVVAGFTAGASVKGRRGGRGATVEVIPPAGTEGRAAGAVGEEIEGNPRSLFFPM